MVHGVQVERATVRTTWTPWAASARLCLGRRWTGWEPTTLDRLVKRAGVRRITVRLARHMCGTLPAFLKVRPKVAQAIPPTQSDQHDHGRVHARRGRQ